MKREKRATNKKHIAANGQECPFCGSQELEFNSVEFDTPAAISQEATCLACGWLWYDLYRMTGYTT